MIGVTNITSTTFTLTTTDITQLVYITDDSEEMNVILTPSLVQNEPYTVENLQPNSIYYVLDENKSVIAEITTLQEGQIITNIKYIKDENGGIISPVTSFNSIYDSNGKALPYYLEDSGWLNVQLNEGVTAVNEGLRYRKLGNKVTIQGCISTTYKDSNITIGQIDTAYAPGYTLHSFFELNARRLGRGYIDKKGVIVLEWIVNISDGSYYTDTPTWIELYFEYFVD